MTGLGRESRTARPRPLLWAGFALLVVFVMLGFSVFLAPVAPWTQGVDDAWRRVVGADSSSPVPYGPVSMFFQHAGQLPGAVLMMILIPATLAFFGRWRSALFVIAVQFAAPGLVSQLAKNIVNRPRPSEDAVAGLAGPLFQVDHGSFPSGHAVSMAAIVITVLALIPASRRGVRRIWAVIGVVLMIGMMWQRTLINAHWLTDTVAGLIAGVAVALLMWWVFWPWLQSDRGRQPWFRHTASSSPSVSSSKGVNP